MLARQLDLRELPSEGGAYFFENTAWHGSGVATPTVPGGGVPAPLRVLGVVVALAGWLATAGFAVVRRRRARIAARRAATRGGPGVVVPEPVAVGAPS